MVILHGDCKQVLKDYPDAYFDSCVTDPPYGLSKEPNIVEVLTKWLAGDDYEHRAAGFMGNSWDSFVPGPNIWREIFRVLKPGGYALVFAGTRTQDLMTIALRLAGFEVRDVIEWLYFSGFPKSMDVSKAFDKREGAERKIIAEGPTVKRMIPGADQDKTGSWIKDSGRTFTHAITIPSSEFAKQWDGWGTALKPAHEPIILVRKPLIGTVADNVERFGTGALNIDGCRILRAARDRREYGVSGDEPSSVTAGIYGEFANRLAYEPDDAGRFPANIVTTDPDAFWSRYCNVSPEYVSQKASEEDRNSDAAGNMIKLPSREAKTNRPSRNPEDRHISNPNNHPTVKPTDLMAWLIRLVTPPGGKLLDPFCGSGSTIVAALREGFDCVGIELEEASVEISVARSNTDGMQLNLF